MDASALRRGVLFLTVVAAVAAHGVAVGAEMDEPEAVLVYESAGETTESGTPAERARPLEIQLGGYLPAFSTKLRVDVRGEELEFGTEIDFEDVLGLTTDDHLVRLDGRWRVGRRSRVGFTYYWYDRSARAVLEEDIQWRDITFPAGAGVSSTFETRMIVLKYMHTLAESERWDVAGSLGVHYLHFAARLETIGLDPNNLEARASAPAPLLMIGFDALYRVSPQWRLGAKWEGLAIKVGDYSGRWTDLGLTAEYFPAPHWALGLGLSDLLTDLSADADQLLGELEYRQVGLRWFVTGLF